MKKIKPHGPLPSQTQLAYLGDELAAFIHFGPNTFYDQEWGLDRRILSALTRVSWMRVSGFVCSRKRASKVDFGGQAPRWLCPLSDSSHRLFG